MDTFSALADPTRRHIIEMLAAKGELSATDIYNKFPVSHPAISQHLKVLRKSHLVTIEKHAQKRIYKVNTQALHKVEDWISKLNKVWNRRFNRLDEILKADKTRLH